MAQTKIRFRTGCLAFGGQMRRCHPTDSSVNENYVSVGLFLLILSRQSLARQAIAFD
jgi:hypothetical protein